MILNTEQLKNACVIIKKANDDKGESNFVGKIELKSDNGTLFMYVTNGEYFVEVSLGALSEDFHATVNAKLFLDLISKLSTETIEFKTSETALIINADGNYKIPLIYNNDEILTLPKIVINNPTVNFQMEGSILSSILDNNGKEVEKLSKYKDVVIHDTQKKYYIDEEGAITFSNGACINKFTLAKPVKMLIDGDIVQLFGLFKNTSVDFTLGCDAISNDIMQTKICLKTDTVSLTAILGCDDTLFKQMPATAIRNRAFNTYPYSVTINRKTLLNAINRIMLFTAENMIDNHKTYGKCVLTDSSITLMDSTKENVEVVPYDTKLPSPITYETTLDLMDFEFALKNNTENEITLRFGDGSAMVIDKRNILIVIPEYSPVE